MEELLKALADPTRAVILDELVEHTGQTLFEICNRLSSRHGINPSRQAISQHLQVLEAAGLVRSERSGRYKFHYVDTAPLRRIAERWPDPGRQPAASEPAATGSSTDPGAPRTGASGASKGKKP
ncbi:ArsR/SmtB family transcription factor [Paeniglutamicibacter psychrophenolicus]|uniref:DNA-binding transcriptional ArsR family regulator n=1 Tax=Paeniglutamicibacter psychrophenolicus TaxID=257454 RepID=A0ABS4WI97_9MICC|nr:DNA-binding transcriptional ArsR family regulator [Paeniglutamicibacter psychrophenolicus]